MIKVHNISNQITGKFKNASGKMELRKGKIKGKRKSLAIHSAVINNNMVGGTLFGKKNTFPLYFVFDGFPSEGQPCKTSYICMLWLEASIPSLVGL